MGAKVLWIYASLFSIGAVLIVAGNLSGKVDPAGRREMWVKYLTYLIVTGSVLASAALHPLVFSLLATVVLAVCVHEFLVVMGGMVRSGSVLGMVIPVSALWGPSAFQVAITLSFVLVLLTPLFQKDSQAALSSAVQTVVGLSYVSILGSHLILLRGDENFFGHIAFFYMLILVNDAMSLLWGRILGKRKIWPVLSPNKTYGGSVAGMVWTLLTGYAMRFAEPNWQIGAVLLTALIIGIFGQLGDVVASAFKRSQDVKDFGNWLPTFGGMLDRFDAFVFTAPMFYYVVVFLSGSSP